MTLLTIHIYYLFGRFARSNSIFLGLWFGYKKPDFLTFLQPLSKEFQDIYSKGTLSISLFTGLYIIVLLFLLMSKYMDFLKNG